MPGSGATYLLVGEPEMTTWAAVAVLVGWSGGALVAGGWSLLRRDAL
jgi:ABC-2 type transport system permease protein